MTFVKKIETDTTPAMKEKKTQKMIDVRDFSFIVDFFFVTNTGFHREFFSYTLKKTPHYFAHVESKVQH